MTADKRLTDEQIAEIRKESDCASTRATGGADVDAAIAHLRFVNSQCPAYTREATANAIDTLAALRLASARAPGGDVAEVVRQLRWEAARSKVSADNENYLCAVTIKLAEEAADAIEALAARAAAAEQKSEGMREALGPFAKAADNYADASGDPEKEAGTFVDNDATISVAHLRIARAALTKAGKE